MSLQKKSEVTSPWPARLRVLRERRELDQQEMGELLGVTREWVSRLETAKGEFSELVRHRIEQLERETSDHMRVEEEQADYAKTRSIGNSPMPPAGESGDVMVNPRHAVPAEAPTSAQCITHLRELLTRAERVPGGVGHVWWQLQKYLPLDEFDDGKKEP